MTALPGCCSIASRAGRCALFCSDTYIVYTLVLPVGGHCQGKSGTVAPERNNGQQRHWPAALRRRSIVVSRSFAIS
jgi:IS1 family transposase